MLLKCDGFPMLIHAAQYRCSCNYNNNIIALRKCIYIIYYVREPSLGVCAAYFEITFSISRAHFKSIYFPSCSLSCCYYSSFNYNKHFWLSFLSSLSSHR